MTETHNLGVVGNSIQSEMQLAEQKLKYFLLVLKKISISLVNARYTTMKNKKHSFCAVDKKFESHKKYGVIRDCRNEFFYSKKPMQKISTQKELFVGGRGEGGRYK